MDVDPSTLLLRRLLLQAFSILDEILYPPTAARFFEIREKLEKFKGNISTNEFFSIQTHVVGIIRFK